MKEIGFSSLKGSNWWTSVILCNDSLKKEKSKIPIFDIMGNFPNNFDLARDNFYGVIIFFWYLMSFTSYCGTFLSGIDFPYL